MRTATIFTTSPDRARPEYYVAPRRRSTPAGYRTSPEPLSCLPLDTARLPGCPWPNRWDHRALRLRPCPTSPPRQAEIRRGLTRDDYHRQQIVPTADQRGYGLCGARRVCPVEKSKKHAALYGSNLHALTPTGEFTNKSGEMFEKTNILTAALESVKSEGQRPLASELGRNGNQRSERRFSIFRPGTRTSLNNPDCDMHMGLRNHLPAPP